MSQKSIRLEAGLTTTTSLVHLQSAYVTPFPRAPGMQEVIRNLSIHHVEFKDESDPEINKHTFTKVGNDKCDSTS